MKMRSVNIYRKNLEVISDSTTAVKPHRIWKNK